MADDEPMCKVEYLDSADGTPEETNWIKRAGYAKVTYTNGCVFTGTFDAERIKQGHGIYIWMKPGPEDDETPVEYARYDGNYVSNIRSGIGKMIYPNGDIYEGEWVDNKMQGEGSYTYSKTKDIYSGSWLNNKKHGEGRYEFGGDSSVLVGEWQNGQIVTGTWELKKAGVFTGNFKMGRPLGPGRFDFSNGIIQDGAYVEEKRGMEEEDEAQGDEDAARAPNVSWKGNSIVSV